MSPCASNVTEREILQSLEGIRRRHHLPEFLLETGRHTHIAEIGVYHGDFIKHLVRAQPSLLLGVDPWLDEPQEHGEAEQRYQTCLRIAKNHPCIQLLRTTSAAAARTFQPNYFDCVYIDADHHYPAVLEDLHLWWKCLRQGGLLAGHDYSQTYPGVVQAVNQFVAENNLKLVIIDGDLQKTNRKNCPTWLIPK